ncbi:MAG TPA: NAD(P)-binding domain-containing protein [Candidatus Binataceae bacterium]|nr:NAD(P)-binding domain-containing protein [Candidatus Binataceae bacterium]
MSSRRRYLVGTGLVATIALTWLLALHRTYSPGPVSRGHAKFEAQCAACHEPWHGALNAGCVDCHGDMSSNKHSGTKLDDKDSGLMPGIHLAGLKGELACLSCHTDHRGRNPHLMRTAGGTCVECHQHPSIADVSKHTKPIEMARGSKHFFKQAYSHKKHFEMIAKVTPMLKELPCKSCHEVETPAEEGSHENIVLKWSGCAGTNCHVSPQDKFLQMSTSLGPNPVILASWDTLTLKHVNAMFEHSPGHLQSECSFCHSDIQNSDKIGNSPDKHATKVLNCFECHAHQQEQKPALQNAGIIGAALVFAQENAPPSGAPSIASGAPEKKIVACTGCHAFHVSGPTPTHDFTGPPPITRPHLNPGLTFAMYVPGFARAHGGVHGIQMHHILINPWWMGALALIATGTMFGAWMRYLPRLTTLQRTVGNVAPQRTTEVPALDDTYQSTVARLYIVGETAGTASINLAMRSGRQSIEFIANLLKFEKAATAPDVYDVAIVGCGPAGISASATAINKGLKYVALEKMTAISTIKAYPRGKFVQATSIDIAEYGSFFMEGDTSKESLLSTWEKIIAQTGVKPNEREEVTSITRVGDLFEVKTNADHIYKTRFVVMAIGVRGSPRHLGLAGETPERVAYNLIEPEEYQNKKLLVVGGGNAGAEVAQALANPDLHNQVSFSFRTPTLGPPVTPENAEKISALQQKGLLTIYPASQVMEIKPGKVVMGPLAGGGPDRQAGTGAVVLTQPAEIDNDFIFAMLGAELPTRFMKSTGIKMIKKGH